MFVTEKRMIDTRLEYNGQGIGKVYQFSSGRIEAVAFNHPGVAHLGEFSNYYDAKQAVINHHDIVEG